MTDPKPTRFSFSLAFLLNWVLLFGAMLGASLSYQTPYQIIKYEPPPDSPRIDEDVYATNYGWPYVAMDGRMIINRTWPGSLPVYPSPYVRYGGLLKNMALFMVVSFAICAAFRFMWNMVRTKRD